MISFSIFVHKNIAKVDKIFDVLTLEIPGQPANLSRCSGAEITDVNVENNQSISNITLKTKRSCKIFVRLLYYTSLCFLIIKL